MKQLYDTTNKLAGKYSKPERPVKDKEGRPVTEIQEQRNRWVEYFEELLNRLTPMSPLDIETTHTDLPIDVNPPTAKEIRMAIRQIKGGKQTGLDNIPDEALKVLLNRMKYSTDAQYPDQKTELRHYGPSLSDQLNGTHRHTSTSLTMKTHSTVWIEGRYRNFFDTME
ncbi:unnamed protein product [Schistosoma mattheei]|uniref:Uncharacterized protein n=1 Tax=Schistosoma mattheei TaxID=31246 RepID=A0A183NTI2_9TREM|nr:unnamed protein product [Schistosoma mattheei]